MANAGFSVLGWWLRASGIAMLVLLTSACDGPPPAGGEAPHAAEQAPTSLADQNVLVAEFFADAMAEALSYNPLLSERLGDHSMHDRWPDISSAGLDARRRMLATHLRQVAAFDQASLSADNRLNIRLFEELTRQSIELDDWRFHSYPMHQMRGWHTFPATHLLTVHRMDTRADAQAFIARLDSLPGLFAQVIDSLEAARQAGIQPPAFVYPKVREAMTNLLKGYPFEERYEPAGPDDVGDTDNADATVTPEDGEDTEDSDAPSVAEDATDSLNAGTSDRDGSGAGVETEQEAAGESEAQSENAAAGPSARGRDSSSERLIDSPMLAAFKSKLEGIDLSGDEKARLTADAERALRTGFQTAYLSLIAKWDELAATATTDDGVWKLPDGDAYYRAQLKRHTTQADLDADTIHQIGLDQVARLHAEMRTIMRAVNFSGDLQEFFGFMRKPGRFTYRNTERGRERYLEDANRYIDAMRARVDDYFDLKPAAPMEIRAVEKFRENAAGKAFYQRSSPDGTRPGIYYVNLRDLEQMPLYQLEALSYHEGIPGHHFQIAIAQELPALPLFRRTARFTAFTEGWGLYTEELGKDMGFYQDPFSDFGRLAMELWRACRLVVDTGIHAKQWTREEAIAYLRENTPNPDGDIERAIERYIVMPGQATAYTIGKLKIMELRNKARSRLGNAFEYRDFHTAVLASGIIPLSVLEENIENWLAGVSASTGSP